MTTRQLSPYLLALRWLLLLMIGLIFVIEGRAQSTVPLGSRRPLVAIWCSTEGNVRHDDSPYLRVAVWEDGRIIFASNPKMWSHDLREGKLSKAQVAELKQRIAGTKVFQLQETSSLVPDAAMDCMMVNIGNKEQILYWDEVERKGYGGNTDPTPAYLQLKKNWKIINGFALQYIPISSKTVKSKKLEIPNSWSK